MAKKPVPLPPGKPATDSGQWGLVGPKGGKFGNEITVIQGKPLPPTPKPGQTWVLVDPTKHKK